MGLQDMLEAPVDDTEKNRGREWKDEMAKEVLASYMTQNGYDGCAAAFELWEGMKRRAANLLVEGCE